MKTILVPVDFSKSSNNAAKYAIQLALKANSKIILLHSYHVPIPMSEVPSSGDVWAEIQKEAQAAIKKLAVQLQKDAPGVAFETLVKAGFAHETILEQAVAKKVNLVVMGTHGASGLLGGVFGSVTSGVIAHSKVPILVIPEGVKYKDVTKIALSVDLYPNAHKGALDPLIDFASIFGAEVLVYHIAETDMLNLWGFDKEKARIGKSFGKVKYTFFEEDTSDVTGGISGFVKKHKVEVLAVISRKHNFIERLFWRSVTRRMALHSKQPLLALPE